MSRSGSRRCAVFPSARMPAASIYLPNSPEITRFPNRSESKRSPPWPMTRPIIVNFSSSWRQRTPVLRHEALRSLRGVASPSEEVARLRDANRGDDASIALIDWLEHGKATSSQPDRKASQDHDIDAWLARLEGPADPAAGERVFFHTKGPGCYRCHPVDGRGGRAGPDLSTLASTTDRRRLVESIVAPSREIAPQFVPWSVARTDGTVFTGILLDQSADGVLDFADSQGRRIAVKSDEIAERKPQTTSIMPDDLVTTMTIQEFRDLLAFLSSRPKAGDPSRVP